MKDFRVIICLFFCFFFFSADLSANIDNLSNMSAEWIRTGARNAATDAADIVIYNPAGLTALSQGIHVNIGNQMVFATPTHRFGIDKDTYEHQNTSVVLFLPNIYAAYKAEKGWVLYGGIYIPAGGATFEYPQGSVTTEYAGHAALDTFPVNLVYQYYKNDILKGASQYVTGTIGGAYPLTDRISLALGMRYMQVETAAEIRFTLSSIFSFVADYPLILDFEDTADGYGWIAGLNIVPIEGLNIGMHYESRVDLEFETEVIHDDLGMLEDGKKYRRDLPGMCGVGVAYDVTERLNVELDFSYWFQKAANWGKSEPDSASGYLGQEDISDLAGDALSYAVALKYRFSPKFYITGGYCLTKFLWEDIDAYYSANLGAFEILYSDNHYVAAGLAYELFKGVWVNLAAGRTIWDDETIHPHGLGPVSEVKTKNVSTVFAFGVDVSY